MSYLPSCDHGLEFRSVQVMAVDLCFELSNIVLVLRDVRFDGCNASHIRRPRVLMVVLFAFGMGVFGPISVSCQDGVIPIPGPRSIGFAEIKVVPQIAEVVGFAGTCSCSV